MFEFISNTISSTVRYCIGRAVYDTFIKDRVDKRKMSARVNRPPAKSSDAEKK